MIPCLCLRLASPLMVGFPSEVVLPIFSIFLTFLFLPVFNVDQEQKM